MDDLLTWEESLERLKQWENLNNKKNMDAYYKIVGRIGKEEEAKEIWEKIQENRLERITFMKKYKMGIYA